GWSGGSRRSPMSEVALTKAPASGQHGAAGSRLPIGSIARHAVLLAFSAVALFPIYFMVVNALKTNDEFASNQTGVPHHPVLSTYRTVIVIYTGIMLPFSTFLLTSFFSTIPRSLLEAARIDGAKTWRTFTKIVLPLSLPALTTVFIVQALWVWNEVLIAVVFL